MNFQTLLVDDDQVILFLHQKMCQLSNFDSQAITLDSGEKLLKYIQENDQEEANFVVFLDINMPGLNAWEVLEHFKKITIHANLFVILVTSSVDNADKTKAKDYNLIIDFIEKPIKVEQLKDLQKHPELKHLF
ncbi:two-component system response regulator [Psychroflexus sp. ALD_RP9]|uniref:response regulator n=1 Tax=Psychroflexus sp. ALD_RP9 TaxID=2777186 RepID=UPI001A8C007B|nr:response regulator [Psychroflexus sp. ALD_RP9]QSS98152.1 response regulator [Psychroflexus sp. ALD_RP9]